MTSAIHARREADDGFTLIELLVVVIIIGILAAIAIPAFLNQRERAWQSELTSAVRNSALEIEAEATTNGGAYPHSDAGLTAVLNFLDANVSETNDAPNAASTGPQALDDSPLEFVNYTGVDNTGAEETTATDDPTGFYLCIEHDLVNDVSGVPTNSVAYSGGSLGNGLGEFAEVRCSARVLADHGDVYVGGSTATES